jgi:hypothetical protein
MIPGQQQKNRAPAIANKNMQKKTHTSKSAIKMLGFKVPVAPGRLII